MNRLQREKKLAQIQCHIVLKCLNAEKTGHVLDSHYATARGLPRAAVAVAGLPTKLTHIVNQYKIYCNISRLLHFF